MQKTLYIVFILVSVLTGHTQTSFNLPVSGPQQVNLGPDTYNYYDNGGPNGNYSGDINSLITFSPLDGRAVEIDSAERGLDMLHQWQVDTRDLANGVYTLRIVTLEGDIIRRVVKIH